MAGPRCWYVMPFRNELDMLRCQLTEHADRVHKFVILEATIDHSGEPKPLILQNYWPTFAAWHDKIEYITTSDLKPSFWGREQGQRDIGMDYLTRSAKPDDLVAVSDVDEFIPRSAFDLSPDPCLGLVQKLRFAAVDWDGSPGVTAVVARAAVLIDGRFTCDTLRQNREFFPPVEPGGYHFSWFGGPERIERKAICSPHQETLAVNLRLAREGYAWQRGLGGVPDNDAVTGNVAEITDDYPEMVRFRECPWYWWRPGPGNLPADEWARDRELTRRRTSPPVTGMCAAGRPVRVLEPGSYHLSDLTPCPTAVPGAF